MKKLVACGCTGPSMFPCYHPLPSMFPGYHPFMDDQGANFGSFEVFYHDKNDDDLAMEEPGWYWWACFPGCIPDGDPSGPFPTAEQAYYDALGDQ